MSVTERPCPECDGHVAFLNALEVWLCSKDPDHCWPADKWSVDTDTEQEVRADD